MLVPLGEVVDAGFESDPVVELEVAVEFSEFDEFPVVPDNVVLVVCCEELVVPFADVWLVDGAAVDPPTPVEFVGGCVGD